MSTIIITSNEPKEIKNLFTDRCEVSLGFDFLLYTNRGEFPIERKQIPEDLIASVRDGRLQRELIAMREISSMVLILLHGKFRFRGENLIMRGQRQWTKTGIRNLLRSLQLMEGAIIETAETDQDLVRIVNEWQEYLDAPVHRSIRGRPRIDQDYSVPIRMERIRYFYAGLPTSDGERMRSLGIQKAKELQKVFPNPIDLYPATVDQIMSVKGFGKNTAECIYKFLRGE